MFSDSYVRSKNTFNKEVSKPQESGKIIIFVFIFCLLVILCFFGFLYFNHAEVGKQGPSSQKDIQTDLPLSGKEKEVYDALGRLGAESKLETQTTLQITMPRMTTSLLDEKSDVSLDKIDMYVVSERKRDTDNSYYHTHVFARSSKTIELDAELEIINESARVMFKNFSLFKVLGMSKLLNVWISLESTRTDLPLLEKVHLPGEIINAYTTRITSMLSKQSETVVQYLVRTHAFSIETPRYIQVTPAMDFGYEYRFTIDSAKASTQLLEWIDPGTIVGKAERAAFSKTLDSLEDIQGAIIIDEKTHKIISCKLDIVGLLQENVLFTIESSLTFLTNPETSPREDAPGTTLPLTSVIELFNHETGSM